MDVTVSSDSKTSSNLVVAIVYFPEVDGALQDIETRRSRSHTQRYVIMVVIVEIERIITLFSSVSVFLPMW